MPDQTRIPTVSVVMPVYNGETYLLEAVDSILSQTFADLELIVVNDGSTDGSAAVLAQVANRDPRLIVLNQENGGICRALNAGIAAARGRYIARMDADDIAHPTRFAAQVAALDARPRVVALGTQFCLIDPEGRALKSLPVPQDHTTIDRHLSHSQSLAICHPAVMMRADTLRTVGGYREEFPVAQDIDLFLRLAEVGELANLGEVLLDYRLHPKSVGHAKRAQQLHVAWRAGAEAARRRGVPFTAPEPGPDQPINTQNDTFRTWGWWALSGGNVDTARLYARRALMGRPLSLENWRLALMALRGH